MFLLLFFGSSFAAAPAWPYVVEISDLPGFGNLAGL